MNGFFSLSSFKNKSILILILLASLASTESASAQIIRKQSTHFTSVGVIKSFQWAPPTYSDATHPNPFFYDIFYYIPESVAKKHDLAKAVIFNHGGGQSTLTREGSINAVSLYIQDLKQLADDLGIIVVVPSTNGLNWGSHTVSIERGLIQLMRQEMRVDPDHIGLTGHSMGGMSITRNYLWLADEFSFFLPLAAGMDLSFSTDPLAIEEQINKVFNVPYIQLQGLQDEFQSFVTLSQDQWARTQALEQTYGVKSKLDIVFYDTTHDYKYDVYKDYLSRAILMKRDFYQPQLWGSLVTQSTFEFGPTIFYHIDSVARYFWVEAIDSDLSTSERIDFYAKTENNRVQINIKGVKPIPTQTKKFRVYLSWKLEDLSRPVTIEINGKQVGTWKPLGKFPFPKQMDPTDAGVIFDDFIDVNIPQS